MSLDMDALRSQLQNAIDKVMRAHASEAFMSRFILVAETVDTDGERGLWMVESEGMKVWDTLGMSAFLHEQAKAAAWPASEDEDDE